MIKVYKIGIIVVLFFLLVLVRGFSAKLFYDPFIDFFKSDFLIISFPSYDLVKLFSSLIMRYLLNSIISLGIIYAIFQKKELVIFSAKFYVIAFIILSAIYYFQLKSEFSNGHLIAFYVRRMLIHPIFLLLLMPAFYYQNLSKK